MSAAAEALWKWSRTSKAKQLPKPKRLQHSKSVFPALTWQDLKKKWK